MTSTPSIPDHPPAEPTGAAAPVAPAPSAAVPAAAPAQGPALPPPESAKPRPTRAGVVWVAVVVALVALILLIIFILQNQQQARILFLGLDGTLPLGMAMLIAAVAGGVLVAASGAARIIQLRSQARRQRTAQKRG
ncbi:DUF1049 domain-containing protein [Paenarthrobacter sp. DKR-5]|uniref:LapA family protein n=1 Tax=Paenarthrobacter sp. DKR-5 TaxID=2835535 RepID=UPI001BDCFCE8|nr:LapA family protein [Paenarthrobacter sp. DKR-5]MBT1002877.1 DUF1049 domain-containing protein [Paenarthrobacter sp. DKR-5]